MKLTFDSLHHLLDQANALRLAQGNASRQTSNGASHEGAFRLFNGFYEGCSDLVLDVYGQTLVVHDYSDQPEPEIIREITEYARNALPWLKAGILKTRSGATQAAKSGTLLFGDSPDRKIKEHGFWYAIDLTMNRDASFYLDTINLRKWLIENIRGKSVLNTFA